MHFLGALNYFRTSLKGVKKGGVIKSAAEVLQPLYALGTDKLPKGKFEEVWENSRAVQVAFQEAKSMIIQAAELTHPNPNYPLALFTDASDYSVGGSLQMLTPEGDYRPLGFYSAHLNPAQKKYSVFKKELLGAFKSLRHFLPEIYGKHVTIWTDHLPLQQAFDSNNIPLNDPQVYRQITEIGRFTRDVKHVSGASNVFADFLSRLKNLPDEKKGTAYLDLDLEDDLGPTVPAELATSNLDPEDDFRPTRPVELATAETVKLQVLSLKALADLQVNCPEIKKIRSGDMPKNTIFGDKIIDGETLFCEITSSPRPYVPAAIREEILTSQHKLDHIGVTPTTQRIAREFYWPSLKNDVKGFIKKCDTCMKVKQANKLVNQGEFPVPDKRFSPEVCEDKFFETETEDETRHGPYREVKARGETFPSKFLRPRFFLCVK